MEILQREWDYFLVLCDVGSMTKAAEIVGIQQAALSKAIARLEKGLNKKLFLRLGRGVRPTEYGILLQRELSRVKELWDENIQTGLEKLDKLAGTYRLAIHSTVAISTLAKHFCPFIEKYPQLNIEFDFTNSKEAVKKVLTHEADLAIAVKPKEHPELVIKPLVRERVALYSSSKVSKDVLYHHPDMILGDKILKKYKSWRRIPIPNYEVLAQFGAKGSGLILLPEPVAERVSGLKIVGDYLGEVNLSLIFRYDRVRTKGFDFLQKSIFKFMKEG